MIVYADILIILNLAIDYYIIKITALFIKVEPRLLRHILAAIIGALSSLIIFVPMLSAFIQLLFSLLICLLMCIVCFGTQNIKLLFRSTAVMFIVGFAYTGGMFAIWLLFKPKGMVIHNSIVYLNISPLFLVLFTVLSYLIIITLKYILSKNANASLFCKVKFFYENNVTVTTAIADTGNSIKDIFGNSEIVIVEKRIAENLFGNLFDNPQLKSRYRAIPCSTVSGEQLLDGYRCDKAVIKYEDNTLELTHPILAISKTKLGSDYSAIINPEILI